MQLGEAVATRAKAFLASFGGGGGDAGDASAQLLRVRRRLEAMTEQLNCSDFEVTESWLIQFTSLHGKYMEVANSRLGAFHEFRSTQDLLQHVLQHPKVCALLGPWTGPRPDEEETPVCGSRDDVVAEVEAAGTCDGESAESAAPPRLAQSQEREHVEDGNGRDGFVSPRSRRLAQDASSLKAADDADEEGAAESVSARRMLLEKTLAANGFQSRSAQSSAASEASARPRGTSAVRRRAKAASVQEAASEDAAEDAAANDFQGRERRYSAAAEAAAWPRGSSSVGQCASVGDASEDADDDAAACENVAARRKLLESKLKALGFQKPATVGGA
eukprot:TRINITY_DN45914_c0_g1_i1.p1 TRINITY_DN45914_c0_g1~~TRINITY_DN45914_c0_g1_i1.p1  ORF type:complete len:360 (+),score=95.22 TRINITY_DN45914_c0_g1_i1:87-1082(+)